MNLAYQSYEDAKKLNNIGVSDRVKTAEQRVENGDTGAQNNRGTLIHVDDDCQRRAQSCEDTSCPEHLTAERRKEKKTSHTLAERVLKRI